MLVLFDKLLHLAQGPQRVAWLKDLVRPIGHAGHLYTRVGQNHFAQMIHRQELPGVGLVGAQDAGNLHGRFATPQHQRTLRASGDCRAQAEGQALVLVEVQEGLVFKHHRVVVSQEIDIAAQGEALVGISRANADFDVDGVAEYQAVVYGDKGLVAQSGSA